MHKKGFTLIELLLVVAIIGILSVIALTSFSGITRSMKLDMATDMLVSAIKQQQGLVKSGRVDVSGSGQPETTVCRGIRFSTGELKTVNLITLEYFKISPDKQHADVCDSVSAASLQEFTAASDFRIDSIMVYGVSKQQVDILFKPPFAKAEVKSEEGGVSITRLSSNILTRQGIETPKLTFVNNDNIRTVGDLSKQVVIALSSLADSNEKQYVIFDPQGGLAYKTNSLK